MEDEDKDLEERLASLRRGDPQALGALFSLYRERLRRMVDFRLDVRLRGRVSSSDVLQEAYIDALKRLPYFQADEDVPFYIWLRTVTVQRLIDVHRHHLGAQARDAAREASPGRGGGIAASSDRMAELMGDLTSPSQAARRGESIVRVRDALERLEPVDREVLALRHFEELTNREVAALLGIRAAAASKRYVRAIERLREALERPPGSGEGET